jgi:uncharacterized DUF497 family protein
MPTWDEVKRQSNLKKHGIDFVGSEAIFDGPVVVLEDIRQRYGELRLNAIGWLHGSVAYMTYTERGPDFHVISLRKAEKHEIKRFINKISR